MENEVVAPTPPMVVIDHDEAALLAAREELKAAEVVASAVEAAPVAEVVAPAPADHSKGNPTAAIIAIRNKLKQVEAQNLLLQGQVQAFSSMAQSAPAPTQESAPASLDPLQAIHADRVALAEAFDSGEMTAKEWEQKRQVLDAEEWELRSASLRTAPAPVADLQLEQATVQLEAEYPVLRVLSEAQLEPLATIARQQAEAQGTPIQAGALGTLEWRTRIAKLANQMYGTPAPAATTQITTPSLSPDAQARADKLALAATMPPNVSTMGSVASAAPLSEADLSARMVGMTEDEQLALLQTMPGLRSRVLGY